MPRHIITHLVLKVVKVSYVVCKMRFEATSHIGSACISAAEERIAPIGTVNVGGGRYVVDVAKDGKLFAGEYKWEGRGKSIVCRERVRNNGLLT